jgi:hypothetical protein
MTNFDVETFRRFAETGDPAALVELIEQGTGAKVQGWTVRPKYVSDGPLAEVLRELWDYADGGQAASRAAVGRALMELMWHPCVNEVGDLRASIEAEADAVEESDGTYSAEQVARILRALLVRE